jgi:hypothetical protein
MPQYATNFNDIHKFNSKLCCVFIGEIIAVILENCIKSTIMYCVGKKQSCSNAKTHDAYSNQGQRINECVKFGKRGNIRVYA